MISERSSTSRSAQKARTRQALLDAAVQVIAERGLDGATARAISDRARVAAGTFFVHFPEVPALLDELLDQPSEPDAFRTLKTKVLKYAMESWLEPSEKKYTEAIQRGLDWLAQARRPRWLEAAGLVVEAPLSPSEVATAVRLRSTPFAEPQHAALVSSLAAGLGVSTGDLAPMAIDEQWEHVRVDRADPSWS